MFKSSFNRKLFGVLGAFLMFFNSFAWGPWDLGRAIRKKWFPEIKNVAGGAYKDPLLPFIYQDAQVSNSQFFELLENLSPEQRENLWKALNATNKDPEKICKRNLYYIGSACIISVSLILVSFIEPAFPFTDNP